RREHGDFQRGERRVIASARISGAGTDRDPSEPWSRACLAGEFFRLPGKEPQLRADGGGGSMGRGIDGRRKAGTGERIADGRRALWDARRATVAGSYAAIRGLSAG